MSGSRRLMLLGLAAAGFANTASAYTYFKADITNANEPNPPGVTLTDGSGNPRPASFGFAEFYLNDAQTAMTMSVTIFNVDITGTQTPYTQDNLTNAHIHGPTAVAGTGTAGVAWGFGTPQNDNNPNDLVITPFPAPGVGGTFVGKWDAPEGNGAANTLTNRIADILAGKMYINFHTSQNAGGELRGFLVVPEPATMSLVALPALAMLRRRVR